MATRKLTGGVRIRYTCFDEPHNFRCQSRRRACQVKGDYPRNRRPGDLPPCPSELVPRAQV